MKIVLVTWLDAQSYDPWDDIKEHANLKPPLIYSCGFLLTETDECIVINMTHDPIGNDASQSLVIPRQIVKEIVILKE